MGDTAHGGFAAGQSLELDRQVTEATEVIRDRLAAAPALQRPRLAVVLGSGLGGVVELLDDAPRVTIGYGDIPHVPGSSVQGHAGELVAGVVGGIPTIILSGRAHLYEGHPQSSATLLLRAVIALGVETVALTNAAGGLDPAFDPGDVMLISDHLNLSGGNPLVGTEPRPVRRALSRHDRRVRSRAADGSAGGVRAGRHRAA